MPITHPVFTAETSAVSDPAAPEELLGNLDLLGQHTRSLLTHSGLSYQEQERHTSVSASAVYAMAQGRPQRCHLFAVKRFAAYAAHRAHMAEARTYWQTLLERLDQDERGRLSNPNGSQAKPSTSTSPTIGADILGDLCRSAGYSDCEAALNLLRHAIRQASMVASTSEVPAQH